MPETSQTVIRRTEQILNETEVVELEGVDGRRVILNGQLEYDHYGITENSFEVQRFAHIANITRNVVFRSENPLGRRGHFMATGDADVTIVNASFESLGRTSADRVVTKPLFNPDGSLFAIGDNQVGRYSVHLHHLENQFYLSNIVVNDALKWGIAVHDTDNGVLQNSIVFDTDGSAIVTEWEAKR